MASDSSVIDTFEPFEMKTHEKLIKKFGVDETTALYNQYIAEKELTDNCAELIGSCDYYLCQEKKNPCGSEGYFLDFGYQYCSDSLKRLSNEVSPKAKLWLNATATCLQREIQGMDVESKSCSQIKRAAIKGHDKCYSEISFCSLSFDEIKKVLLMIMPTLTQRGVLIEGAQVLTHCVSRKS